MRMPNDSSFRTRPLAVFSVCTYLGSAVSSPCHSCTRAHTYAHVQARARACTHTHTHTHTSSKVRVLTLRGLVTLSAMRMRHSPAIHDKHIGS